MADVDQWLAEASQLTRGTMSPAFLPDIEDRLAGMKSPQAFSSRQDVRRTMLCAAAAALFSFTGAGVTGAFAKAPPTWVAAPPASSPFSILVGR